METSRRNLLMTAALGVASAAATEAQQPATPPSGGQSTQGRAPVPSGTGATSATDALAKRLELVRREGVARVDSARKQLAPVPPGTEPPPARRALYERDAAFWTGVQERARTLYGVDADPSLAAGRRLTPIETAFRFSPHATDSAFRPHHAETLLDQSADLLERGLAARAEWNDLLVRSFNVSVDLQEFFELDRIHQDETAGGFYTHEHEEAQALYDAESLNSSNLQSQADFVSTVRTSYFSQDNVNSQSGSSQLLAFLSHLANYDKEAMNAQFMSYSWNGVSKTSYQHAQDAATNLSFNTLYLQQASAWSQLVALSNNAAVARAKSRSYAAKSAWERSNAGFRQRRTEVSRRLADRRSASYTQPDGVLNYPERIARVQRRFDRDFRDALARVKVAVQGLSMLYGYDDPLPPSVVAAIDGGDAAPAGAFDECLIWVRNAIAFLVKWGQVEQKYSLPISIREVIGEQAYKAGRKATPSAQWSLGITRELLPDQYHVRLRGVSVYVVADCDDDRALRGVWLGRVSAPPKSVVQHLPRGTGAAVPVDQDVPPVLCGRITRREHVRAADISGGSTLFNLSPIGAWDVRLQRRSTEGTSVDDVQDIVVEFHLAMRMR